MRKSESLQSFVCLLGSQERRAETCLWGEHGHHSPRWRDSAGFGVPSPAPRRDALRMWPAGSSGALGGGRNTCLAPPGTSKAHYAHEIRDSQIVGLGSISESWPNFGWFWNRWGKLGCVHQGLIKLLLFWGGGESTIAQTIIAIPLGIYKSGSIL